MANKLDLIKAQLLGWHCGKYSYTAKEIVESIGLRKSDYIKIREELPFDESDIEEIDRHLKVNKD